MKKAKKRTGSSRIVKRGLAGRRPKTRKTMTSRKVTARSRNSAGASRNHKHAARSSSKARRVYGRRRANPDLSAEEQMYEIFHGRAPEHTIEYEELVELRSKFAELGKLLELRFDLDGETPRKAGLQLSASEIPLLDFGAAQAVCTADGTNIYFLGGDQRVNLEHLAIASNKDYVELGPCTFIKYFTKKGFHNFDPVEYWHRFGEEDGIRPVLAYDTLNQKLFLLGGNYRAEAAGIIN